MTEEKNDENIVEPAEPQVSEAVIEEGKFFAIIGYLSFLCLVPLLLKKDNEFALFHGKQALVLFILELAVGLIKVIPFIGEVVGWIGFVVFGLLSLFCIYKVISEEMWEIPVIYEISKDIKI